MDFNDAEREVLRVLKTKVATSLARPGWPVYLALESRGLIHRLARLSFNGASTLSGL